MAKLPFSFTIEDLKDRIRIGFKLKEIDPENRRLVLVGNEQIMQDKDQLILGKLDAEDEEIEAFIASPFYERSLLQTHDRGIVLIDLADFSKLSNDLQVRLITRFQFYIRHMVNLHQQQVESVLSTGDGYFIIYREEGFSSMLRFVMKLIQQLSFYNFEDVGITKFYFRIAINIGRVHFFFDINERWNYVGDGINDAKRIIDFIPHEKENAVYLSANVYELHKNESFSFGPLQIGLDKHKKEHQFVELFYQRI
ncbi:hypothetical protein ACFL54_00310 [Planctomycetota bacterium]